ncbi:MAG: xylulokinase, partial [Armatimonadetes bacterium]|nr:xylulokinase [Armatimonadota bacterium]
IIWMDRRAVEEARYLGERFGDEIPRRTGLAAEATFTASKLLWLRRHEPEITRRAHLFLQPRDCLYHRLTGSFATDPSLASRTMLYDLRAERWWAQAAAEAGVSVAQFPRIHPSSAAPGTLRPEAAGVLGLPAGSPVALGAGDRACEALGLGLAGGAAMVSTGTTTNVSRVVGEMPEIVPPGVLCSAHCLPGAYLLEQGLSASGSILRWLRYDLLGNRLDYAALDALAAQSPPGARGVFLLPFFIGARATRWNPAARGMWFGLTLGHTLGDLARSVMEGVAYEVRACLEVLGRAGASVDAMVAAGGGARSALWRQIIADVAGVPVAMPAQPEAASLGAMLLAAAAVGALKARDLADVARRMNPTVETARPDEGNAARYAEWSGLYNDIYTAVAPLYGTLQTLIDEEERSAEGR